MEENVMVGREQYEEAISKFFVPSQVRLVMLAYRLSKYGHRGQERDGGGRYFEHPKTVSLLLLEKGVLDYEVIISALLHDLMEDSYLLTWDDLELIFGRRVCTIVKMLTKEKSMAKPEYFPRLHQAMPEAWLIKLADRLHNLATVDNFAPDRKARYITETREKIMPLCDKLVHIENGKYSELGLWFAAQLEAKCQQNT